MTPKFGEDRSSSFGEEPANQNCVACSVRGISSNISGYTGPIFTIVSPHESALHADNGTVLYFAIG